MSSDLPTTTLTLAARLPIWTSRVPAASAPPTKACESDAPTTSTAEISVKASEERPLGRQTALAASFPVRILMFASPKSLFFRLSLFARATGFGRLEYFAALRRHPVFLFLPRPHDRHGRKLLRAGGRRGIAAEILRRDAALIARSGFAGLAQGERERSDLGSKRELLRGQVLAFDGTGLAHPRRHRLHAFVKNRRERRPLAWTSQLRGKYRLVRLDRREHDTLAGREHVFNRRERTLRQRALGPRGLAQIAARERIAETERRRRQHDHAGI